MSPRPHAVAPAGVLATAVAARVAAGARLCGLFAWPAGGGLFTWPAGDRGTRLVAVLSDDGALVTEELELALGATRYRSLTPQVPAAGWYERRLHDLFGLEAVGHPRLDPLVLPRAAGVAPPRAAGVPPARSSEPSVAPLPAHVRGEGVLTLSYGPVRSGVFESVEYLLETSGEDIPHLRTRVFYKHRGIEARFPGLAVDDGVLLAERVEGVAAVAHATAFCHAAERAADVGVPLAAQLVRLVHAELERIANHLDTVVRHTEAAGQAVAYAVVSHHKERVQRLRARLCGSRFGRGVVVPGGVAGPLRLGAGELLAVLGPLQRTIRDDTRRLMETPSFVDRLRGTGVLSADDARRFAVVGPVGRASGLTEDVRVSRPYGAYERLGHRLAAPRTGGDALARQWVRIDEIEGSFRLVRQGIDLLDELGEPDAWRVPLGGPAAGGLADGLAGGLAIGWAEAPQGEVLSLVGLAGDRVVHATHRSPSFHNLAAFPAAFPSEVFTDVAFVEASFGLSMAGAAG